MTLATHNKIGSFIWSIADDVLRNLFRPGKYLGVILPMYVHWCTDAVLELTKQAVLDTKQKLDEGRITEQAAVPADFEDYLNGIAPNLPDIFDNFKFRNQLPTIAKADALGTLINNVFDPDIDLLPACIENHSIGAEFEELVCKFTRNSCKPQPLCRLAETSADIPAIEKEVEGMLMEATQP